MSQQQIGWGIEAKLLAQIKKLIASQSGGGPALKEYASLAGFPPAGSPGAIYLALDTNKIYYWDGSAYVELAASSSSFLSYSSAAAFPPTGDINTIYLALDTSGIYYWNGSAYVEISPASPASLVSANLFNYYNFI